MKNLNEIVFFIFEQEKENNLEREKIKKIIKRSKQFIVISGPSGSGKTMIIKHLVDNYGFIEPPFVTTRELRMGEKEIGGVYLSHDEFLEKETNGKIFLTARNYGNVYGYDLDIIYSSAIKGKKIVVEAPASNLTTDVAYFLPESTIVGMVPLAVEEIETQLIHRGLNDDNDRKIRLSNFKTEKEQIIHASGLMNITQIVPTHSVPQNTFSQIDKLMDEKRF